jgi:hypothetical protein
VFDRGLLQENDRCACAAKSASVYVRLRPRTVGDAVLKLRYVRAFLATLAEVKVAFIDPREIYPINPWLVVAIFVSHDQRIAARDGIDLEKIQKAREASLAFVRVANHGMVAGVFT